VETGRGKNPLLEQPQLAGAGHGLGAVGSPELVEDVADVLLTVSTVTTSSSAIWRLELPASSSPSTATSPSTCRAA